MCWPVGCTTKLRGSEKYGAVIELQLSWKRQSPGDKNNPVPVFSSFIPHRLLW